MNNMARKLEDGARGTSPVMVGFMLSETWYRCLDVHVARQVNLRDSVAWDGGSPFQQFVEDSSTLLDRNFLNFYQSYPLKH